MSKGAGNLIGVAAVVGVGYLAYKNGLFASIKALLLQKPSNNPANPNFAVAQNKINGALVDGLKQIQVVQDARDVAKLGPIYNPLVTLADPSADDGGSWSSRDGNYEPGNYQP